MHVNVSFSTDVVQCPRDRGRSYQVQIKKLTFSDGATFYECNGCEFYNGCATCKACIDNLLKPYSPK